MKISISAEERSALSKILTDKLLASCDSKTRENLLNIKSRIQSQTNPESNAATLTIYVDGAADLKKKKAGIGGVLLQNEDELLSFAESIGEATNNVAEYKALIRALDLARQLSTINIAIYADSELIVRQILGEYRVKHERMKPLHREAMKRLANFQSWSIRHIPREKNKRADKLSKDGMNGKSTT